MHLAEGILPLSHAAAWAAVAAPFVVAGALRLRAVISGPPGPERALLGMAGALTFAITVFPVPVPGIGATSHMCATPLLAILLGPRLLVVPTAISLLVQALFLAHGGLTTLGANVLTLGIVGPYAGWAVAHALRAAGLPAVPAVAIACFLGDAAVYLADAGILGLGLAGSQPPSHWTSMILLALAPIQTPLAILEGALSAWLVAAMLRRRADLVPVWLGGTSPAQAPAAPSRTAAAAVLAAALLLPSGRTAFADESEPEPPAGWSGADEAVFERLAAEAGMEAKSPVIDVEQGDLGLFVFSLAAGTAGFVLGRWWERSMTGAGDAPRA